jgi:hypothetical protein
VIGLGLRLAVAGGREAVTRLAIIAAAVALGVGLLLTTLAAVHAVDAQAGRYAWLNTTDSHRESAPLLWRLHGDYFHSYTIGRVDLAITGPDAPVPPGLPRLPGPGEYYASPALSRLLDTTPADQLGDRFPGHQVGTIGAAGLPGPDTMLIIIGRAPAQLAGQPDVEHVTHLETRKPSDCASCEVGVKAAGMDLILSVVAGALVFPLLMFIGTATRLAAARREQRFAAMRLVGATPRQVARLSVVESAISAVAGTALGFGVFALLRAPAAAFPFTGDRFFAADLSLGPADVLLVALGVPVASAVTAGLALRRVRISPLGVARRATPRPPRAYRLIPLALGLAELAAFQFIVPPHTSIGQVEVFLPGFLVVMAGLVIAGPWLTMVGARLLARRTRRPATLIAARRLADNPKAGFRAVSGLVLALFVTTVSVGAITTIVGHRGTATTGPTATNLTQRFPMDSTTATVPASLWPRLHTTPGVQGLAVVRQAPIEPGPQVAPAGSAPEFVPPGLVPCAELAHHPAFGRCAPGATVAGVFDSLTVPDFWHGQGGTWPTEQVDADQLDSLPVMSVVVGTDGSPAALERARTILAATYPDLAPAATEANFGNDSTKELAQWKQLANVVILCSLAIAGCSLAVSVVGGLAERKRPFSLLRLTGVPLRLLRRVIALETAVPLLAAALVAVGAGLLSAHLFLTAQMHYRLASLGPAYYAIVAGGLVVSLGIIASTLPLLRRITGPETARNE